MKEDFPVPLWEDVYKRQELVCPQKPEVWKFYAAVFNELKDIFPSDTVHLGCLLYTSRCV